MTLFPIPPYGPWMESTISDDDGLLPTNAWNLALETPDHRFIYHESRQAA